MTLVINGDVVLDEQAGVQTGSGIDDISFSAFQAQVDSGLYSHLFTTDGGTGLNLPTTGSGGFPQVAWQSGFISISDPVTDLALVSSTSGAGYPPGGLDSGLTTDAGDHIYLFPDAATPHVVIGKTLGGEVAFVIALDEHSSGGQVTGGDMYMIEYMPLHHPDTAHIGTADEVDLSNLVYVSATATTTTHYSDFSGVPSGQDVWVAIQPTSATVTDPDILVTGMTSTDTVNVSKTGLGTNSQAINQGEGLRVDFVNGAPTTLTSTLVHNGANISYTDHATGTGGGFSTVQTNPSNTTVTARVHAYDATGNDQGQTFIDDATTHQTSTDITGVKVYSGTGTLLFDSATDASGHNGISVDLSQGDQALIGGLTANDRVDFTTAGQMDRFTVENVSSQSNRAFDIGDVYLTRTSTNVDNTEVGSHLHVADDGPVVALTAAALPTLTVDESTLGVDAHDSFAGAFTTSGGADGLASASYHLGATAGACGLVDTATGEDVILSVNGDVVEGRTQTSNDLVFTVSVDSTSGEVTLDQIRPVVQPIAGDTAAAYDDATTLSGANLVTLTRTATDGDGDQAHATVDIGQQLSFKDDGPSVTVTGTPPTLTVDETALSTNATDNFAGVFTVDGGADSAASTAYHLGVTAGPSGLVDTATGENVILSMNGDVVEGRTATSDDLVFTVSVDASGDVTLDQIRAVQQPVQGDTAAAYDDPVSLSAADLVTLTRTVTDGDGDTAHATADIGQSLVFKDDGPSVTADGTIPTVTVDESTLAVDSTVSFASVFTPNGGADGLAASGTSYHLGVGAGPTGLVDTGTGEAVVLSMNGDVVEGRTATSNDLVFTVSVNGAGEVTLDQLRALVHPTGGDTAGAADESVTLSAADLVTLTAQVTDGDGDTASATANIGQSLVFKDDGPTISVTGTLPTLTVDETNLAVDASANFANVFSASGGADSLGSSAYHLDVTAGPSGLVDTATGENVVLSMNGDVVEGRTTTSNDLVFTVAVDGSGEVTLDQIRAVVQPVHGSTAAAYDDPVSLSAANLVRLTRTVTDGDGDTASATADIGQNLVFKDDGPSITTPAGGSVLWASGQTFTQAIGANLGADGGGLTIASYSAITGMSANLSSDGQHLTYSNGSGPMFQLDLSGDHYDFHVLQNAPTNTVTANFSGLKAGSPTETLTATATGTNVQVTFDGILFSGLGPVGATLAYTNPGAASTQDDLNPDRLGFGVKGGQASQMNENEGFFATGDNHELKGLAFDIQGVGNLTKVNVEYWLVTGGNVVDHEVQAITLPKGNALYHEAITSASPFDDIYVRFYFDQSNLNAGVRTINFQTQVETPVPAVTLDLTLQATDGDFDTATTSLFHLTADPFLI